MGKVSSAVDNRIVELSFDNRDFESKMQTTLKSLDTFDKSLDSIDGKSLEKITEAASKVDLSGITSAALSVKNSFSAMEIVAMTVIQNITNSLIRLGRNLWANTFGQIKSGGMKRALNIEQATFLLEGLGLEVQKIKDDAMYAVEGTAYGFDEAAKAAAAFGASGVKAGDDMKQALLGVSGVAAMTGSNYANIADIFTTISSNGKLMTMQLRQFATYGLNVSAVLGEQLGKTEKQINEMVRKGEIDFNTFSKAMNDAFGKHAKDANKTFTGSLANMKAALSRIGEAFATPFINSAIPVFNTLKDLFNQVKSDLSPFIEDFKLLSKIISVLLTNSINKLKDSGKIAKIFTIFRNVVTSLALVLDRVKRAFSDVFPGVKDFTDLLYKLSYVLIPSQKTLAGIEQIFRGLFAVLKTAIVVFRDVAKFLLSLTLYFGNLGAQLIQSARELKKFIDPFLEWVNQTKIVEKTIFALIGGFIELKNKIKEITKAIIDWVLNNEDLMLFARSFYDTIAQITLAFVGLVSSIDAGTVSFVTFGVILVFVGEMLRQIFITGIQTFTSFVFKLYRIVTNITTIFSNLSKIVAEVKHVLQMTVFEIMANILLKLAVSIGILTISLTALSKIKVENILKAGFTLAALGGILIGVYAAFSKITKANTLNEITQAALVSLALFGLSSAFISLALSMKILSTLNWSELIVAFLGMATIVGSMVVVSKLAKGIKSSGFLLFANAIFILSLSMSLLTKFASEDKVAFAMALGSIMSLMSLMMYLSKYSKNLKLNGINTEGFKKLSETILTLSIAMSLMTAIGSKDKTAMAMALGSIITMMAIMIYMAKMSSTIRYIPANSFDSLANCLLKLSLAVALLIAIGKSDHAAMGLAIGCMLGLMLIIELMKFMDNRLKIAAIFARGLEDYTEALIKVAIAMSILTYFTSKDKAAALVALGSIAALTLVFGAMQELSTKLRKEYGWEHAGDISSKGMNSFAKALIRMAVAMSILTYFTSKDKAAALVALGSIIILGVLMGAMLELCEKYDVSDSIKYSSLMKSFASSMLIMSIAMSILSNAFKGPDLDLGKLANIAIAFGIMLGATAIMFKISENANRLKTEGMFRMASSILILSSSMMIISLLPISKILAAAAAISVMSIALGFAGKLMKDATSIKTLFMFPLMAGGVVLLASALLMLQNVDWSTMLVAAGALSLLSVALAAVSKFKFDILSAAGFAAMSAGIILLAYGLSILAAVPADSLITAGIAIGILTAAIVGLGAISGIPLVTTGLIALSVAMLSFGASTLMIGAAVAMVVNSFNALLQTLITLKDESADTINNMINNIKLLFQGIIDTAPLMGEAIGTIITTILMELLKAMPLIIAVIALIGSGIKYQMVIGLVALAPVILEALMNLLQSVADWADQHQDELYDIGFKAGYAIAEGAMAGLAGITYYGLEALGLDTTLKDAKANAEKMAASWREHYFDSLKKEDGRSQEAAEFIVKSLSIGIESGYITYEQANEKLAEIGLEAFKDKLEIHSPSKVYEEQADNTILGLLKGVFNGEVKFEDAMSELAEKGALAFSDKLGSFDLLGGMFDLSSITGSAVQKSAYDYVDDQDIYNKTHGAHSKNLRWKAEGYESAEAWEAQNKQLDPLTSLLKEYANQLGIDTDALDGMTDATDGLTDANKGLADGMDSYLAKAAKQYGKFTTEFADSMTDALKSIYDEVKEEDPIGTDEMLKRMKENTEKVGKWARQLRELAAKGMSEGLLNELKDMGPQAADKVDAFARMTADQLERANQLFASKSMLPTYATEEMVKSYENAGYNASLGFWEGLDHEQVKNAFYQLGMEGLEKLEESLEIESPSKKTMKDGAYATEGLAKGLNNGVVMAFLKTSVNKVADAIINGFKTKLDQKTAAKLGSDFISGLANGFSDSSTSVRNIINRANYISNAILDTIRSKWDEHSPSRKAEELGLFFMRGLGVGLEDGSTYLERQTGEKADDILQSMKDKLYGSLINVNEGDMVYEPVIRPVFDLSALDEGLDYINSWFAEGRTISIAGNIQRLTPTTKENNDVLDREILDAVRNLDVDGVRNELNGIRTDISELQAAVTNLQVVMDTGALVGQLVNPMDNALGAKALFNGRGRY